MRRGNFVNDGSEKPSRKSSVQDSKNFFVYRETEKVFNDHLLQLHNQRICGSCWVRRPARPILRSLNLRFKEKISFQHIDLFSIYGAPRIFSPKHVKKNISFLCFTDFSWNNIQIFMSN